MLSFSRTRLATVVARYALSALTLGLMSVSAHAVEVAPLGGQDMAAFVTANQQLKKSTDGIAAAYTQSTAGVLRLANHYSFTPIAAEPSLLGGMSHQRYQLQFKEIPVWGFEAILHRDGDGQLKQLNGHMAKGLDSTFTSPAQLQPKFTPEQALSVAQRIHTQLANDTFTAAADKPATADKAADFTYTVIKQQLVIYIDQVELPYLAHFVHLAYQGAAGQIGDYAFIVDAQNGQVLKHWDSTRRFDAKGPGGNEGTGIYEYGQDRPPLDVINQNEQCWLYNNYVSVYDYFEMDNRVSGVFSFGCDRNTVRAVNNAFSPLNDGFYHATVATKMFDEWYHRRVVKGYDEYFTIDDKQMVVVHTTSQDNQQYAGAFISHDVIYLTDGDELHYPYTTLDVVGHEIGHQFLSSLAEPWSFTNNPIQESFADITGEAAEFYLYGVNDWHIGKEVEKVPGQQRRFIDPTADGHSISHTDAYRDDMDPHLSAGIVNKAFYLLATTNGWGFRSAYDLLVTSMITYGVARDAFQDFGCHLINTAMFSHKSIHDVGKALAAVGIYCPNGPVFDLDADGMSDLWELAYGLNFQDAQDASFDLDGDGISNLQEYILGTLPNNIDSDGDTLSDADEVNVYHTKPFNKDSDGDGLPDDWEVLFGLDPLNFKENHDFDNDGFSNYLEYLLDTSPVDAQSKPPILREYLTSFEEQTLPEHFQYDPDPSLWRISDDNASDGVQALTFINDPLRRSDKEDIVFKGFFNAGRLTIDMTWLTTTVSPFLVIINGEQRRIPGGLESFEQWKSVSFNIKKGYSKIIIRAYSGDFSRVNASIDNIRFFADDLDSDHDGISDSAEFELGLDRFDPADANQDLDGDGLTNVEEIVAGTDNHLIDSDHDGLTDFEEVKQTLTDPNKADTDNDSISDGEEVALGLDPLSSNNTIDTDGDGFSDLQEYGADTDANDPLSKPTVVSFFQYQFDQSDQLPSAFFTPADVDLPWLVSDQDSVSGHHAIIPQPSPVAGLASIALKQYLPKGKLYFDNKVNKSFDSFFYFDTLLGKSDKYVRSDIFSQEYWQTSTKSLTEGFTTLRFNLKYLRDSTNSELVWIDNVVFIADGLDQDNDHLPDQWEYEHGLNFNDATDAQQDEDNDGLSSFVEYELGLDPRNSDSDGDSINDGDEVNIYHTAPARADSDLDGMPDNWEISFGFDPLQYNRGTDSDNDGLNDYYEYLNGSDPTDPASHPNMPKLLRWDFDDGVWPTELQRDNENNWSLVAQDQGYAITPTNVAPRQIAKFKTRDIIFLEGQLFVDVVYKQKLNASFSVGLLPLSGSGQRHRWKTHQYSESLRFEMDNIGNIDMMEGTVIIDNITFIADGYDGDEDGLPDSWEYGRGFDYTDPSDAQADKDNDGLSNFEEFKNHSNPSNADSDGDGLPDGLEVHHYKSSPTSRDSDGDGMPDQWEATYGLVLYINDALQDADNDGVSNLVEFKADTNPLDRDSKPATLGSFYIDFNQGIITPMLKISGRGNFFAEIIDDATKGPSLRLQTDVLNEADVIVVLEGVFPKGTLLFRYKTEAYDSIDFLNETTTTGTMTRYYDRNWGRVAEHEISADYHKFSWLLKKGWIDDIIFIVDGQDADQDGLDDLWEHQNGYDFTDPNDANNDADGDGLTVLEERTLNLDDNNADVDGDGISDGDEVNRYGTNPRRRDSDSDGMPDDWEISNGLDPNAYSRDIDSDGDGVTDYIEYLLGTAANDPNSNENPISSVLYDFEDGQVPIKLTQPADATHGFVLADRQARPSELRSTGRFSLVSSAIGNGENAQISMSGYFPGGKLIFDFKAQLGEGSEANFYVNSQRITLSAADDGWQRQEQSLSAGIYTLTWEFTSTKGNNEGFALWLDNIAFLQNNSDTDNDTMDDYWEYINDLDFTNSNDAQADLDNDGLTNVIEYQLGSKANNADSDGDGLSDGDEVNVYQTSPTRADSDNDKMPDGWEVSFGLDPTSSHYNQDSDGDGISDVNEYLAQTSPIDASSTVPVQGFMFDRFNQDSPSRYLTTPADSVGQWQLDDSQSVTAGYSWQAKPLDRQPVKLQWRVYLPEGYVGYKAKFGTGAHRSMLSFSGLNRDQVNDEHPEWVNYRWQNDTAGFYTLAWSFSAGTTNPSAQNTAWLDDLVFIPKDADQDADGLDDGWEYLHGFDFTDPSDALLDHDNDGLTLVAEVNTGLDYRNADTDGDGLSDGDEVNIYGTNGRAKDTDGDGIPDGAEVALALDPLVSNQNLDSDGDGLSDYEEYLANTNPHDASSNYTKYRYKSWQFDNARFPEGVTSTGDAPWVIANDHSTSPGYSLKTPVLATGQSAGWQWQGGLEAGYIYFNVKTQFNSAKDSLKWVVGDNQNQVVAATNGLWQRVKFTIYAGFTELQLVFNNGDSAEQSAVWVDDYVYFSRTSDQDQDGILDHIEYELGMDYTDPADASADFDGDGLTNSEEINKNMNIFAVDTDFDGLTDDQELNNYLTSATNDDSDGDNLPDGYEVAVGLDPKSFETYQDFDGDGYANGDEWLRLTDPTDPQDGKEQLTEWLIDFDQPLLHYHFRQSAQSTLPWQVVAEQSDGQSVGHHYQVIHDGVNSRYAKDLLYAQTRLKVDRVRGYIAFKYRWQGSQKSRFRFNNIALRQTSADQWSRFTRLLTAGDSDLTWTAEFDPNSASFAMLDDVQYLLEGADRDGDGMTDIYEFEYGLDLADNRDEALDPDNDGLTNRQEFERQTDPNNADSDLDGVLDGQDPFPLNYNEQLDSDGDGIGNNADNDDDNDGVIDSEDAFPLDPTETADSDGDGVGDNRDRFPNDASEQLDTDGDGIGNNADTDDDNDGVVDSQDAFPFDATESVDSDGDGIGNQRDLDDDNDGISDIDEIAQGSDPLDASSPGGSSIMPWIFELLKNTNQQPKQPTVEPRSTESKASPVPEVLPM